MSSKCTDSGARALLLLICLLVLWDRPAAQVKPETKTQRVGQKAPEFVLPDTTGKPVQLVDLLSSAVGDGGKADPKTKWVVLIFYRGYW